MILILDANALVSNPNLLGKFWVSAAEAIEGKRLRIVVPKIAFDEAVATYRRTREATAVSIRKEKRHASDSVRKLLEAAASAALDEGEAYAGYLEERLRGIGAVINQDIPMPSHEELARRAIQRVRPFSDSGSGYRDSLHWWFVLGVLREHWEDDDVVFVSSDVSAFGIKDNGQYTLHPDLQTDVEGLDVDQGFEWALKLADVSIPGVFLTEQEVADWGYTGPDDLEYLLLADILNDDPLRLSADEVGLHGADSVRLNDASDPKLINGRLRVYYVNRDYHVDFEVALQLEVVTQSLVEDAKSAELVESNETVSVILTGYAEISNRTGDVEFFVDTVRPD
jgi:hypothetical protein